MYLITIEGVDASGKETQSNLLYKTLSDRGVNVKKFAFPNYESYSSDFVKAYLNEKIKNINPYGTALLFSIDRYITYLDSWKKDEKDDVIYIVDRYIGSNMIHQGHRLENDRERQVFFEWLKDLEFTKLSLPKPNIVFYLQTDLNVILERVKNRNSTDIHEKDKNHLINTYNLSNNIYKQENWEKIECVEQGKILSKEEILDKILSIVEKKVDLNRYKKN